MLINRKPNHKFTWVKWLSGLLLLTTLLMLPQTSFASNTSLWATKVHGKLAKGYSKHYLAVKPTQRDTIITLTLNIESQDKRRVNNKVNLLLLTADDLRRVEAGDKPEDKALAFGSPTTVDEDAPFEQIFNKTASFKASGTGIYTVIVYSRAPIPTAYTLTAENAEIGDGSSQVVAVK